MSKRTDRILLSRRRFLQVLAGGAGALMVGIGMADTDDFPMPAGLLGDPFQRLSAFVRIDNEGNVLIGARDPDTGTGVATSLPRIIADEMDADWRKVSVVSLGLGVSNDHGKPDWTYGHQLGGTGTSIPAAWRDLRQVGALVRWLLLQAAARQLKLPIERLHCEAGRVVAADGRFAYYGNLAAAASKIALPRQAPAPKTADQYRLIGKPAGDVDAVAMVTGQARFAIDEHDVEALVAVVVHSPWPDGALERIDTADTLAVKGVVKVIELKPEAHQPVGTTVITRAVAVLAKDTWSALQGRDQLKLKWKPGAGAGENSSELEHQADALVSGDDAPTIRVRDDGDVEAVGKHAARRLQATYHQPWLAHATAEPMNCLVRLDKDQATPQRTHPGAAESLGRGASPDRPCAGEDRYTRATRRGRLWSPARSRLCRGSGHAGQDGGETGTPSVDP